MLTTEGTANKDFSLSEKAPMQIQQSPSRAVWNEQVQLTNTKTVEDFFIGSCCLLRVLESVKQKTIRCGQDTRTFRALCR